MNTIWPVELSDFETFLKKEGLEFKRRDTEVEFDNKILQYDNANIAVRVISDRGIWFVEIADNTQPDSWYDVAMLRDLILGKGNGVLSLSEQIEIVENNWARIINIFDSSQREKTHVQLALLQEVRAKRLFPSLYPPSGNA